MGLHDIDPLLDQWVDDHVMDIYTEALERKEVIDCDLVAEKLLELAKDKNTLITALREIAECEDIHTKLNQVRLCCKFQNIAMNALRLTGKENLKGGDREQRPYHDLR